VTQVFGFATLGSLMALRGGSDSGARIGGLLAVLTGTMFLVAAIAYWRACHRRTGERPEVPGIPRIASNAPTLAGLERRSARPAHHARYPHRRMSRCRLPNTFENSQPAETREGKTQMQAFYSLQGQPRFALFDFWVVPKAFNARAALSASAFSSKPR
jgi:hypothetical protein